MNAIEQKAHELKSLMTAAGITNPDSVKRVLETQCQYVDSYYSLTDDEKQLFLDAAAYIIAGLDDTEWSKGDVFRLE